MTASPHQLCCEHNIELEKNWWVLISCSWTVCGGLRVPGRALHLLGPARKHTVAFVISHKHIHSISSTLFALGPTPFFSDSMQRVVEATAPNTVSAGVEQLAEPSTHGHCPAGFFTAEQWLAMPWCPQMQTWLSSSHISVDNIALNRAPAKRVQYFNFCSFWK